MTYLRRAFGIVALLLLAFVAVGVLLPGRWSAERTAIVGVQPDSAFTTLRRVERWGAWMPWPEGAEAVPDSTDSGGAGVRWDDPLYGSGRVVLTGSERPRLLTYEVTVEEGAVRVRGRIRLEPGAGGTRIRWREEGEFGRNPLLGYTALTMEERQGAQLEAILERLRRELEDGGAGRP